jgi:hypothetical protein
MRDIGVVVKDIISLIPDENEDFKTDILEFSSSLCYSAPETLNKSQSHWHNLCFIINEHIPHTDYHKHMWCKEIIDIYLDTHYKCD